MQDHDKKYKASKDNSKGKEKLLKDKNTEDGVNFRGGGCNVPLMHPKKIRIFRMYDVLILLVWSSRPRPRQKKNNKNQYSQRSKL